MTLALFLSLQAPLKAAAQAEVVIRYNGQAYVVTSQQINEQGAEGEQDIKVYNADGSEADPVHIVKGMTLKQLLDTAQVPSDLNTILLDRAGGAGTLYASRDDADIVFYSTGPDAMRWIRRSASGKDPNSADNGALDAGTLKMNLHGRAGNVLKVTVTATPSSGVHAGTAVEFTAKVKKGVDGETFNKYTWDFGDGKTSSDASPSHTYANKKTKQYTVQLTVEGDKDSIGQGSVDLNVKKPASTSSGSGSGGTDTGTGGGGSGGTSGGGSGSTFGGGNTGGNFNTTPPPSVPSTPSPSLPAPQTPPPSTPPSSGGKAPSNPGFDTSPTVQSGTEVTGILVSAPASASQPGNSGANGTPAKQPSSKGGSKSTDWKIPAGVALAALLLILGALREHMPTRRLLPSANETGDMSAHAT